jgi:hypothetical protein
MWFVMLNLNDRPTPLMDDDTVALFETEDEADKTGYKNPLGKARGFKVYEWSRS